MTCRRLLAPVATGLAFSAMLGLGAVAPAWADRAVALSFQEKPDYARITAKWADGDETAPKIAARVDSQVLILKFDQKVTVNLDALKKGLPNWAVLTRMDPDGETVRIGLKQGAKIHVSTSLDMIAVDLLPPAAGTAPPDIVSPLVAKKKAEADKKRIAALPPPVKTDDLEVRGSQAGLSSRVAFYWPGKVAYKVVGRDEGVLKLLFAHQAKADLAYLHISPPENVADFRGENTPRGYLVTVTAKDKLPIKAFYEGDVVVLDITRPPPAPEPKPPGDPPPQKPDTPKAGAIVAARTTPETSTAEPAIAPRREAPIRLVPPKSIMANPDASAKEAAAAAAAAAAETAAHDASLGGPDRKTELSSVWKDPAPPNHVVDVKVLPLASGVEFQLTFAQAAPAAVFSRGNAVWAVFAANADLKVNPASLPIGFRVRTQRSKNATMMRIEMPKGLTVSAESADAVWTVRLAPTATRPYRFLQPGQAKSREGRSRIETMLPQAAGIVWFEDPVIGDQIAAVVSYGPSSASPTPRDFIEASLPATAHGLAIVPKSDDAVVTLASEKVIVSMQERSQTLSEVKGAPPKAASQSANPAFIDFTGWGARKGEDWYRRRERLEAVAASLDAATPQGAAALLDLARFYLGHEMAQEALGVMRLAAANRPEVEQSPDFLGMRGAANVMAHRLRAADADLSSGALRNAPSAALWRGLIAVERGEWERASDFFRQGRDGIHAYPPAWAARFAAAAAEAALNINDYNTARRLADDAIATAKGIDAARAKLVLAELTSVIDGPAKAYDLFAELAKTAPEPVAVRAELKRLETGAAAGKMSANEAAGQLESLRFRWRGDDVEMQTVGILADQYMNTGRFRDALQLAQSAALRDPAAPGARDLRIKLADYFRRLFLAGEVDRLDPIQALALFYEFNDLTPVGADGDQMIRKLAQRLVAFDLLDPAANLLQHQVDNRLRGVGQSAVAVDLAKIYLWDRRPDKALAAINGSRQPGLPKDLMIERRLLEAAAYRDIGRFDHAIELVEPLDGVEAKSLLADSYWRARQWPEAAKAFLAMLPAAGQTASGQAPADKAAIALRAAISARMAKDESLLADIRRKYMPLFDKSPDKASFDLITAQVDVSGAAVAEAIKRLADAPTVDAFATAMKARFDSDRKMLADQAAAARAETAAAAKAAAEKAKATRDEAAAAKAATDASGMKPGKKRAAAKGGEGKAAAAEGAKPKEG